MPSRKPLVFLALALLILSATACYDSNDIKTIQASPDGRYLAIKTAHGELGILDHQTGAPLSIYSHYLGRGLAWSPDSRRLIFVEEFPRQSSVLWILNLETRRREKILVSNAAWKGDPVWLSNGRIAFLTDQGADHLCVQWLDLETRQTGLLLDRGTDVSRLWGSPRGDSLVFQSVETGSSELWCWRPSVKKPIQLTRDLAEDAAEEHMIAFSRDGRRLVYISRRLGQRDLVLYDLDRQRLLASLPIARTAGGLAFVNDNEIATGQGDHLLIWRPFGPWWRRSVVRSDWDGITLGLVTAWGSGGVALAANGNLLLTASNPYWLAGTAVHARSPRDLILLANSHAQLGHFRTARGLLDDLWQQTPTHSPDCFPIAMAQERLNRLSGDWTHADEWLSRALAETRAESPEGTAAHLERLALAAFERRSQEEVLWNLDRLPPSLARAPLADWIGKLAARDDKELRRAWFEIGGRVRQGDANRAAPAIQAALSRDDWTTWSLAGLRLIVDGDLEPTAINEHDQNHLDDLIALPGFQLALLQASRLKGVKPVLTEDLRALLLNQWARKGDLDSARLVVREDLDAGRSTIDYAGMLRNYLMIEELDLWFERSVAEVFLSPSIFPQLEARLTEPGDRQALWLAAAKAALIEGDYEAASRAANRARVLIIKPPADLPPIPDEERGRDLFLVHLFEAKILERRDSWDATLKAYRQILALMEREPNEYDIAPFEVANAIGVIEAGRTDHDLLDLYLTTLRGLGDPLINPTHDANTLHVALSNLETLRRFAPDRWLLPYLTYSQGMCYSLLNRPWQALHFLHAARDARPPDSLTQRILLEEGALRENLGEHALAARLYGQILETVLPVPVKALAMQAAVQAETAAGQVQNPITRLNQLLAENPLPAAWKDWLYMQFGVETSPKD